MRAIRQDGFGGPEVLKAVEVADPVPLPTVVLVGGVKMSGIGCEGGIYPLNFYSEPSSICIKL
jgi:hypothetical protein